MLISDISFVCELNICMYVIVLLLVKLLMILFYVKIFVDVFVFIFKCDWWIFWVSFDVLWLLVKINK